MKEVIKKSYRELFSGLFAMIVALPAVVLFVATATLCIKLLFGVVMFIWG